MKDKKADEGAATLVLIMMFIGVGLFIWGLAAAYWPAIAVGTVMFVPLSIAFARC